MARARRILLPLVVLALVPLAGGQTNSTAPAEEPSFDAGRLLVTLAAIIGLGFAGFLVFDRFRIADTIFLIAFGILLAWFGLLDVDLFRSFQPLVAVFAVLIIMFDSGLDLRFGDLALPRMGWGIAFSTIGFATTVLLVGALGHYALDLGWPLALVLGCAVTDTAGLVILPIISQLGVPGKVKTALLVETSLPDVLGVTLALVLLNLIQPADAAAAVDLGSTVSSIVGGFATTAVIGLLAGLLWIRALGWLATRRYSYMTTLAAVLALNWAVQAVGGSGALAVLLFGLVIGNRALFGSWSDVGRQKVFRDMAQFNGEVAFLVRSFFFVYLGVILDVDIVTTRFLLISVLIVAAIVAARALAVYTMTARGGMMKDYRGLLMAAIPRGTTAAVISTLPASRGIKGAEAFAAYAVVVILLTNLMFTIGLYLFFRGGTNPARDEPEPS